jgi:hypothetical protein
VTGISFVDCTGICMPCSCKRRRRRTFSSRRRCTSAIVDCRSNSLGSDSFTKAIITFDCQNLIKE